MERLRERHAHEAGAAGHAVEPGVVHHREDRAHAALFVPDAARPGAAVLDLARRIRAVAELVLEPLDVERVAAAIGPPARHEEAGGRRTGARQREREQRVAHRRGVEPFVSDQLVDVAADRVGERAVRAHVAAALLLGHAHPDRRGGLVARGQAARVVARREHARLPLVGHRLLGAQRRNARVGHRDRTGVARLHLVQDRVHRRARHVGARARLAPRQRVHRVLHRERHQRVPGGMERDLVDPMAEAVERGELGRMAVRVATERERLGAAHHGGVRAHARGRPAGALARETLAEGGVLVEEIHVLERRRLVLHRMRGAVQLGRICAAHLTDPACSRPTRSAPGRALCARRR